MYEHGEIETSAFHCEKCGGTHEVLQERGE